MAGTDVRSVTRISLSAEARNLGFVAMTYER